MHPSQKPDMDKANRAQSTLHMIHKLTAAAWMNPDKRNRTAQLSPDQIVYSLSQELINYVCCVCYTVTFDWYRWHSRLKAAKVLEWGPFSAEFWVIMQIIFLARAVTSFLIALNLILNVGRRQKEFIQTA